MTRFKYYKINEHVVNVLVLLNRIFSYAQLSRLQNSPVIFPILETLLE